MCDCRQLHANAWLLVCIESIAFNFRLQPQWCNQPETNSMDSFSYATNRSNTSLSPLLSAQSDTHRPHQHFIRNLSTNCNCSHLLGSLLLSFKPNALPTTFNRTHSILVRQRLVQFCIISNRMSQSSVQQLLLTVSCKWEITVSFYRLSLSVAVPAIFLRVCSSFVSLRSESNDVNND